MRKTLTALALCLPFAFATLPAAALDAGKDYTVLSPAQPVESKGKIEVMEFFWYYCPHCFQLEGELHDWLKKLPRDVVFKRQPAVLSEKWEPMARAYFALEALGQADKLHTDVFIAVHDQNQNLNDPETFFSWAAKQGVDKDKLKEAYNSFAVGAKVARAKQMTRNYKLTGVPSLVVNGKYVTSASHVGSHAKALEAVDQLVAMERKAGGKKR